MGHYSIRRLVIPSLFLISLLTVPARVLAQDATITGTITDATGGVLPGVTVTATHEAIKAGFARLYNETLPGSTTTSNTPDVVNLEFQEEADDNRGS